MLHDAAGILTRIGQYFGSIEAEFDPRLDGLEIDHSQDQWDPRLAAAVGATPAEVGSIGG